MDASLFIVAGVAILGSGGAAWATSAANTKATDERLDRLESRYERDVANIRKSVQRIDVRTARMEERMMSDA